MYTDKKKEAKTTESGTIWYRDKKEAKATESGTNAPLAFPFNSTGTGPVPSNCRGVSPARLIVSWDQRQHQAFLIKIRSINLGSRAMLFTIKLIHEKILYKCQKKIGSCDLSRWQNYIFVRLCSISPPLPSYSDRRGGGSGQTRKSLHTPAKSHCTHCKGKTRERKPCKVALICELPVTTQPLQCYCWILEWWMVLWSIGWFGS